jgi:hypothetical protein
LFFIIKELLNHAGKNSFMARVITFNDGMNIFNQKSNKRYVRAVVGNTCTPGFCSAGEHKVRPYIGFGNWLDLDYYDLPENL